MMPKAGVFKRSEVFQVLNDQQLMTKEDEETEESNRWTKFLQKPNRPPPQPKNYRVLENTYKPMIVKQPKPKCAPDYRITPSPVRLSGNSFFNFFLFKIKLKKLLRKSIN